eukprot:4934431-Pyramimonas_sp.AAC.1
MEMEGDRPAKAARQGYQESPSDTQESGIWCEGVAHAVSRAAMLHGLGEWTYHRDCLIASEKNWKKRAQITRCTYGSMSHGFVPWDCWFAQEGGPYWWRCSKWTFQGYKELATDCLSKLEMRHTVDLFTFPEEKIGGRGDVEEEEEENGETHINSREGEMQAKRLAANLKNETEFQYRDRAAVELKGAQWRWVAQIIDCLDKACDRYGCRAPAYGMDIWKDFYREGNKRADELTWEMRDKPGETPIAVRGSFDGGASSIGAGGGWWLEGEFVRSTDCGGGVWPGPAI